MILHVHKSCFAEYPPIFSGCKMHTYKNMFNHLKKLLNFIQNKSQLRSNKRLFTALKAYILRKLKILIIIACRFCSRITIGDCLKLFSLYKLFDYQNLKSIGILHIVKTKSDCMHFSTRLSKTRRLLQLFAFKCMYQLQVVLSIRKSDFSTNVNNY